MLKRAGSQGQYGFLVVRDREFDPESSEYFVMQKCFYAKSLNSVNT